jgi:hypothetical protein
MPAEAGCASLAAVTKETKLRGYRDHGDARARLADHADGVREVKPDMEQPEPGEE